VAAQSAGGEAVQWRFSGVTRKRIPGLGFELGLRASRGIRLGALEAAEVAGDGSRRRGAARDDGKVA
jgi:hypothetical protein